jgi:hypothetical protein
LCHSELHPLRKDDGPKDLDISNGPYVCLDNIGAFTHRGSLEDALRNRFKRLRVRCATNIATLPHCHVCSIGVLV